MENPSEKRGEVGGVTRVTGGRVGGFIFNSWLIWVSTQKSEENPQNGWFIEENHIKINDLGGFPPIFGNTHFSNEMILRPRAGNISTRRLFLYLGILAHLLRMGAWNLNTRFVSVIGHPNHQRI